VKILTFQTRRFRWTPFQQVLPDAPPAEPGEVMDAVVAFLHVEQGDVIPPRTSSIFRQTLKHIKWVANKRGLRTVVLHSFTHLGGATAPADDALGFLERLGERLTSTGYTVYITPFGWVCEWDLQVHGESMAKVWKAID